MRISAKQKEAIDLAFDPQTTEILWGSGAGCGKSYIACVICVLFAKLYPGVRIFVGRKTLKSLKQSTINTLLTKVHPDMGIEYGDYHLSYQDMVLEYTNGSKIIFGELDYLPSDNTFSRLGSLEVDFGIIEEAGEIVEGAFSAIKSRTGRGILAKEHNIPGFVLATCNPVQSWLKTRFYDIYKNLGGGEMQKWAIGDVEIGEEKKPAYRAFLRATAYDNPFLPPSYIDNLKSLPDVQRKRLLGNWDYADEDDMLFKSGLLDKATTYQLPENRTSFVSYIGVDVSAGLGDKTVFTLIQDGVTTGSFPSRVATNWDKTSQKPIFRLMADELIEFAQRNGFTSKEASHIAVEGNGLGQALITTLKERGWFIREYTATHKSRSENYYQLSLDMDSGTIKLYHEMASYDDLRKELSGHTFKFENQTPSVCKKEDIKMRIGHSPDFADSLEIACWCLHQNTDKKGDRYNSNRILY